MGHSLVSLPPHRRPSGRAASFVAAQCRTTVDQYRTVQALNTVLVRALVDGEIEEVLLKGGTIRCPRGDVLVKLTPPFEATCAEPCAIGEGRSHRWTTPNSICSDRSIF